MPGIVIKADIIVNTSAAGVDLIDLKQTIEKNIINATKATNDSVSYNITLALATPSHASAKQYTGVFQPDPNNPEIEVTVPLVFVDITYDDSPKIAVMDDMQTLLFETIPTIVKETVVQFLTPRVDIGRIQFTRGLYLNVDINSSPPGLQPFVNPNLERRMRGLEMQIEQILPLLNSKL